MCQLRLAIPECTSNLTGQTDTDFKSGIISLEISLKHFYLFSLIVEGKCITLRTLATRSIEIAPGNILCIPQSGFISCGEYSQVFMAKTKFGLEKRKKVYLRNAKSRKVRLLAFLFSPFFPIIIIYHDAKLNGLFNVCLALDKLSYFFNHTIKLYDIIDFNLCVCG